MRKRYNKSSQAFLFNLWIVAAILCLPIVAVAQDAPYTPATDQIWHNYTVKNNFTIGWRDNTVSGNDDVYRTFKDLRTGVRLLDQSLELNSLDRKGLLFDRLTLNSFGFGGDPNAIARLNVSKDKWYEFTARFSRDLIYFDYNLLANPLNPSSPTPLPAVNQSPNQWYTARRMTDLDLTLKPLSGFTTRLGYSRNVEAGPSISAFHIGQLSGLETETKQEVSTTFDHYRLGVDMRLIPKTNISFDQSFQYFKNDSNWTLANTPLQLTNGTAVDPGIDFPAGIGCNPVLNPLTTPATANPACTGALSYERTAPSRSRWPMSTLSLQSRPNDRIEISAQGMYSAGSTDLYNENSLFNGLLSFGQERTIQTSNSAHPHRVLVGNDEGITFRFSRRLRLSDSFHFNATRSPGLAHTIQTEFFGTTLNTTPEVFSTATCPSPFTAVTCPQHGFFSPPDLTDLVSNNYYGLQERMNFIQLQYDLSLHMGGSFGYRYRKRLLDVHTQWTANEIFYPTFAMRGDCSSQTPDANGVCNIQVNDSESEHDDYDEHSLVADLWARPMENMKGTIAFEWSHADGTYTRIMPKQTIQLKLKGNYQPKKQFDLGYSVNLKQATNDTTGINGHQHDRNLVLHAAFTPEQKWGGNLEYSFSDVYSAIRICYPDFAIPTNALICNNNAAYLDTTSLYTSHSHSVVGTLRFSPAKRVNAFAGVSYVHNDGDTLLTNVLDPFGTVRSVVFQPTASVEVQLKERVKWRTTYDYYGYGENDNTGPVLPRNFHAHNLMVALHYSY